MRKVICFLIRLHPCPGPQFLENQPRTTTKKQRTERLEARINTGLAKKNGAGNRTRTDDPRITNALLYQLSYPGIQSREVGESREENGRGNQISWPTDGCIHIVTPEKICGGMEFVVYYPSVINNGFAWSKVRCDSSKIGCKKVFCPRR